VQKQIAPGLTYPNGWCESPSSGGSAYQESQFCSLATLAVIPVVSNFCAKCPTAKSLRVLTDITNLVECYLSFASNGLKCIHLHCAALLEQISVWAPRLKALD